MFDDSRMGASGKATNRPKDRREGIYLCSKRAMDLLICMILVPVFVPVIILCIIAIMADSKGPVFYMQERTGRGGKRFRMYKLRTMVQNAHELKDQLQHLNIHTGPDFKIPQDPRITTVGRILRKTSLDELPQILNVILGDMTLVGPRPTSFKASTYDLWHTERLRTTPGITGLWQVSGRSNIGFDDRVRLDVYYIQNRSLWLDLKILWWTFSSVLNRDGAA